MKPLSHFILLFFVVLLLSACDSQDEVGQVVSRVTPMGVDQPTAFIQSNSTHTPSVNLSEKQFVLTIPDSQTLIQLRMNPYQMPLLFANGLEINPITLPELTAGNTSYGEQITDDYFSYIENDFKRYYPQEILGASEYLFPHYDLGYSSNYLFGRGVIDFLNTYGHTLDVTREQEFKIITDLYWYKGKIILKSIPMQLDNDLDVELLLQMRHSDTTVSSRFSASAYVPVNITSQNHLQIIPNDFYNLFALACNQVDATHDLNRDKQNDILFYCEWPGHYTGVNHYVELFGLSKEGVYRIGETENVWTEDHMSYEIEIADMDADGFEEITQITPCNENREVQCESIYQVPLDDSEAISQEHTNFEISLSRCEQLDRPFVINSKFNSCFYGLRKAVFSQSIPDIHNKITDFFNYLPANDPTAQPYIEHLTYLLGYHFELNGDEETAVSTYLTLIQQAPNSPWSWLAWARLAPIES